MEVSKITCILSQTSHTGPTEGGNQRLEVCTINNEMMTRVMADFTRRVENRIQDDDTIYLNVRTLLIFHKL